MTREEIGAILKNLRIQSGKTQKEVAKILGRNQPIVGHWESGYAQPDANTLFTLCDIYGTSVDAAFGFKKEQASVSKSDLELLKQFHGLDSAGKDFVLSTLKHEAERVKTLEGQATQILELQKAILPHYMISYYQRMGSAGSGEYLFDDIPTDLISVQDTPMARKADFALGINGESMEPTYHDGDKVFVKKANEIPTGSIGVFLRGNECFIKELGVDRLISHNKDYDDIPANEDIRVVGLVLGKVEEE